MPGSFRSPKTNYSRFVDSAVSTFHSKSHIILALLHSFITSTISIVPASSRFLVFLVNAKLHFSVGLVSEASNLSTSNSPQRQLPVL